GVPDFAKNETPLWPGPYSNAGSTNPFEIDFVLSGYENESPIWAAAAEMGKTKTTISNNAIPTEKCRSGNFRFPMASSNKEFVKGRKSAQQECYLRTTRSISQFERYVKRSKDSQVNSPQIRLFQH
ncbi:MAG TPA: hypothetical protein PLT55_03140, partial [Acidimicrobiia bacterium]|nr:hypothetical protein [Acidimicrobiia bacterium]